MTSARETTSRTGKRVEAAPERRREYRKATAAYTGQRGSSTAINQHGKREQPSRKREQRRMWQMLISAVILVAIIGCKLAAPDVLNRYRGKVLDWIGQNTDFTEAFSAVGRAINDGGISDAIDEAYQEVFGSDETVSVEQTSQHEELSEKSGTEGQAAQETEDSQERTVYTQENLPDDVSLAQQILGFSYATPLQGTLSSGFGYREHPLSGGEKFHYGLDIAADEGTVIHAFADGTVTAVGESSELGNYAMVAHENGYVTLYAHCSRVTASSGQAVTCGDPIAEVGQTGEATGPHLHFELHQNTTYCNPIYYVTL